jgi:hypothetical protein
MHVTQTATATLEQSDKLAVLHHVAQELAGLGIICHRATWNVHNLALAIGTCTFVYTAILSIAGKYMTLILEVQQCPVVTVSTQDNVTALTAVTAIGTTIGDILCTVQMRHTTAATA